MTSAAMALSVVLVVACAAQSQAPTPVAAVDPPEAPVPLPQVPFGECNGLVDAESWSDAAESCSLYLDQNAKSEPLGRRIRAHLGLGYSLWQQGGAEKAGAPDHFKRAVELSVKGRPTGEGVKARLERYRGMLDGDEELVELVDAIAKAWFYLGEEVYERFDALEFPIFKAERQLSPKVRAWFRREKGRDSVRELLQALRYMPPEERHKHAGSIQFQYWAERRFGMWFGEAEDTMAEATSVYLTSVDEGVPEWEMASSARIGAMNLSMALALDTAPIDPSIEGDQEMMAIYRDALDERAMTFYKQASTAFEHCLEVHHESKLENEWSRRCSDGLKAVRRSGGPGTSTGSTPTAPTPQD